MNVWVERRKEVFNPQRSESEENENRRLNEPSKRTEVNCRYTTTEVLYMGTGLKRGHESWTNRYPDEL